MPAWSNDSTRLAFVMGTARGWLAEDRADVDEIRWMDAGGGESHRVVTLPDGYQAPSFNSDGTRIYYMDEAPPPPNAEGPQRPARLLRSVRLDGTDKKTHMKLEGFFVLAIPSPDDEFVAIQNRYDAYLAAFPRFGTETVTLNLKEPAVPVKRLTTTGANYIHWADGGKTITWSFGNEFSRVNRDTAFQAEKPEQWKADKISIALEVPREAAKGDLLLRNARIITMKGDEVIEHGDILVENNRIKEIGATGKFHAPAGAKVIDVRGKTILPGFVDIHAHLRTSRDEMTDQEWSYAANLAYGVTTTRDPSIESNVVFAQGELVAAGEIVGPRIYSTGTAITTEAASITSFEDADNIVKRYKAHGADSLKQYMQPRRIQRQWLAMAAAKEGVNITAEGGGDLKTDLSMVLDGYTGVEHGLPAIPIYKDVVQLEAQAGTTYTPTLIVSYGGAFGQLYWRAHMNIHDDAKVMRFTPHEQVDSVARRRQLLLDDEYVFPLMAKGAGDILKAGGHVALGSHGEQQGIGAHWEIWMLQSGGMTPWQTLYAATMNGAESIGLEKQVGSLEPGKLADIVVYNANPADDIHNTTQIQYVIKNGIVYNADTLDEVWPTEKKFPPFFWKRNDADYESLPDVTQGKR
jgi:imidazolonepropionase-like amidohydrolase